MRRSLRLRLVALVLAGALPLLALMTYQSWRLRWHASGRWDETVLATLIAFLVASVATWRVSAGILSPVKRLTEAVSRIAGGDFDGPIEVRGADEIGLLADGFREMQGSLGRTFESVGVVAEAGRAINETMDARSIARTGLRHIATLLHGRSAALTVFRGADGRPHVHGFGTDDALGLSSDMRLRVRDHALRGRTRRLTLLQAPSRQDCRARFLVSLPLTAEGEFIGRVDLIAAPEHGVPEFERSDVELAVGLAQQLGIALANARRFETEALISQTLQDALLTKPFPIRGIGLGLTYRPAMDGARVGGDFYDFIRVDEHRVAVVLGDISGKGIAAARHTAAAKGALRSFALDDPSPASVLSRANTAIAEQVDVGTFVTAFYALLDTRTGMVRYANAGHPAPFLVSVENDPSVLYAGGPPLGVRPGTAYSEERIGLARGERLVLFSDGLTEARSPDGALLGDDDVGAVLGRTRGTPQGIANALARAAEAHARGPLADDLAVVVLERGDPETGMTLAGAGGAAAA
ncbi:MAG: SpoIIE family protein phosphatase [Coriobacteriia bacterium]|nr:SpoIIE family protein phosphatase [Coriobacteriia bacterium]